LETEVNPMRAYLSQIQAVVGAAALLLAGAAALGGEGITITVTNDGVEDIYVTVVDTTANAPLIEHQRLNGFATIPVSASADATGLANISWTTISVDNRERHCGRGTRTGLDNEATVNVHADSGCQ
jgi:hypothetical protein